MGKRILTWSLIGVLIAGVCILLFKPRPPAANSFRMPDGREISFVTVTSGTNQTVVFRMAFQTWLHKVFATKFKDRSRDLTVHLYSVAATNTPMFWFYEPHPAGPSAKLCANPIDEYGFEFDEAHEGSGVSTLKNGGRYYYCELSPGFPRGKIVGLAIYGSELKTNKVATVFVPQTAFKAVPEPNLHEEGMAPGVDISFELTSFVTGLKSEPFGWMYKLTNSDLFTHLRFRVTKNGRPVQNWYVNYVSFANARGKTLRTTNRRKVHARIEDDLVYNMEGLLDPSDGPLKIQAEFVHDSNFSPKEIVTIRAIPFRSEDDGKGRGRQYEARIQGQRLIIESLPPAMSPRDVNWTNFWAASPHLHARLEPLNDQTQLRLVGAVNEEGQTMTNERPYEVNSGEYFFSFIPTTKAKTMNLEFALERRIKVQFKARPTRVQTEYE